MCSGLIYFELGSDRGHEEGAFDFESVAAICDSLGMVSGTGGDHSSLLLLGGQPVEGVSCSSDFEGSDVLHVLSFEENIGLVLVRKVVGFVHRCVSYYLLVLLVGLVNFGSRDHFGLLVGLG